MMTMRLSVSAAKNATYKTVLSTTHALDIMTFMFENGPIKKIQLECIGTNFNAYNNCLYRLVDAGLVDVVEIDKTKRSKDMFKLNENGMAVAGLLKQARDVYLELFPTVTNTVPEE
jgi:hypothetical protein